MEEVQSKTLITHDQIQSRIQQLCLDLKRDYSGKKLVLVGVMKGSFVFMADLIRALWKEGVTDCEPDFVTVSSYGKETESSKEPVITKDLEVDVVNRHVLIVEDIIDTGHTLDKLVKHIKSRNPASLKVLALLSKPARREIEVPVDYLGFEIENKWVLGYGFDIGNTGRGRPDIEEKIT